MAPPVPIAHPADRRITGLSHEVIAALVTEVGPDRQARHEARLSDRPRRRAIGAGARDRSVFVDRLPATLAHVRHGVTHDVLACWFGVDRSTITRAIGEVRPLLAERGCTVEGGVRPRTLADVIARIGATGQTAIIDATEIRVRCPAACCSAARADPEAARTSPRPARPQPPSVLMGSEPPSGPESPGSSDARRACRHSIVCRYAVSRFLRRPASWPGSRPVSKHSNSRR
ncbi:helix-turn-helix domain-containing protein [Streptomyces sp. NRRL B-1677]|uniref:helix-turn-helix domain-containing protein n=1 Tax=Streptomyces sp. NRRL B-1677 TaxID=2682966 RepID=UPI001E33363B|nr:transposase family protein [Streptomyces sp. NRRL B-1677]